MEFLKLKEGETVKVRFLGTDFVHEYDKDNVSKYLLPVSTDDIKKDCPICQEYARRKIK